MFSLLHGIIDSSLSVEVPYVGTEFVMRINTSLGDGTESLEIPYDNTLTYLFDLYYEQIGSPSNNGLYTNQTSGFVFLLPNPGIWRIKITGTYPSVKFANTGSCQKVTRIENWGNIVWESFNYAFSGCSNMTITATDYPNLSNVT